MIRFAAATALAGVMLAAAVAPAATAPAARPNFDGAWSVLIVTEKGTCDRAYRYPIKIANGTVDYAGTASFSVTGRVGANGAVTVIVSRGSQSANGSGYMSATDGGGRWQTAGGECSGTWSAEKRS